MLTNTNLSLFVQMTAQVPVGSLSVIWNWTSTPAAFAESVRILPNLSFAIQPKKAVASGLLRIHCKRKKISRSILLFFFFKKERKRHRKTKSDSRKTKRTTIKLILCIFFIILILSIFHYTRNVHQ